MNIINELFERVFVITCEKSLYRLQDLLPTLNNNNIVYEVIVAPRERHFTACHTNFMMDQDVQNPLLASRGNSSLISANESVFLKCKYKNIKRFCIIEDDILFRPGYTDFLQKIQNQIPEDWNVLNLGWHCNTKDSNPDCLIKKITPEDINVGTHFMGYNNITEFMLEKFNCCDRAIDLFYRRMVYSKCNSYFSNERIFVQKSFRTYEKDRTCNYKVYPSVIDV